MTEETSARKKSGGQGAGDRGGTGTEESAAPAPEQNRMESLLEHWNIPRPDIRPAAPEPSPTDGPPVTAVAADQKKKGSSPGPDGLTLVFTVLVSGFVAWGGRAAYRSWSSRYLPA